MNLLIKPDYQKLILPLSKEKARQLEINIMLEGCKEPITVWNNTIIDGHKRYEICSKFNVDFSVEHIYFNSDEEAVSYICSCQLKRIDLSEEMYKYLIGKSYEAEKIINYANNMSYSDTANKLGEKHKIAGGTVYKYASYSLALDIISLKSQLLFAQILSSEFKVSHSNILILAKLNENELKQIKQKDIDKRSILKKTYHTKKEFPLNQKETLPTNIAKYEIKSMPKYDPDAEVIKLTLTLPSWTSSVKRTLCSDLTKVSLAAKLVLIKELTEHKAVIENMINAVQRKDNMFEK